MSKFLVTGGGGFIGSNIVEELIQRKEKVRVLDNFSTGKRENIQQFLDEIELIEGDIRSYHIVREAVNKVDYILHLAALPSVPRSINDPITTNEVNTIGTLHVLHAARNAKVKRVIFASSSSVYGDNEKLPKKEDMIPKPLSPYAVSKLACEKYCEVFIRLYGLEVIILRYFNVFGPKQDPDSQYSAVIPKFIHLMKNGKRPIIFGDGDQSRDFTFVDNIVQANLLACKIDIVNIKDRIFNIACGDKITINQLVNSLNHIMNKKIAPIYKAVRPGDVKHSLADINKAQQFLGYKVKVEFIEGLDKTIDCYRYI